MNEGHLWLKSDAVRPGDLPVGPWQCFQFRLH